MGDSDSMTIEFLRARLQAERSVSKAARERAEELSKRVVELEEQLQIVTLQRKIAKKAAAKVLSILETNGISDLSEENDSSCDREGINYESEEDNNSMKKEKNYSIKRLRKKEAIELQGCDGEASRSTQRSLSWKSCNGNADSFEKKHANQVRRRTRSMSFGETSPNLSGKSRHHIKRKETRSVLVEIMDESLLQEKGTTAGFGDSSNDKDRREILEGCSQGKELLEGSFPESRRDVDMERALEDQALLISRHEREENAQREWEEKFTENCSCTPDSCEPGNRSDNTDITEEGETCIKTAESAHAKTIPNGFASTSPLEIGSSQAQKSDSSICKEFSFPSQEILEAKVNKTQEPEWRENNSSHPTSCESSEYQLAQTFPTFSQDQSSYEGGSSRSQTEPQVLRQHEASNGVGNILESLKLAKLSLKNQLASQRRNIASTRTSSHQANDKGRVETEIPSGYTGLFRVPTDMQFETTSLPNGFISHSDSGSSLSNRYNSDLGVGIVPSLYSARSNLEMGSRVSPSKPCHGDSYEDYETGLLASSDRFTTYPSYADVMLKMPMNDGFQGPYLSNGSPSFPVDDHHANFSDRIRSNMRH